MVVPLPFEGDLARDLDLFFRALLRLSESDASTRTIMEFDAMASGAVGGEALAQEGRKRWMVARLIENMDETSRRDDMDSSFQATRVL